MRDRVRVIGAIFVYDAERYMEMTIRCARSSDLSELEIVVIDDADVVIKPDKLSFGCAPSWVR